MGAEGSGAASALVPALRELLFVGETDLHSIRQKANRDVRP